MWWLQLVTQLKHPTKPMRSASREGTKEAGASQWPLQALSGGPRKPSADRSCATHGSLPPKRRWRCLETCMFAARAGGWRCRATCLTGQSPENKDYDLNANSPVVEKRPPPSESPFLSVEFTDSDSGDLQLQGSVVGGAPPWSKAKPMGSESLQGNRPPDQSARGDLPGRSPCCPAPSIPPTSH